MARQPGKGGTETDYVSSRIYSGPLAGPMMRALLQVSADCCEHFGIFACLACPLEEFIPDKVPSCGISGCGRCAARLRCPCGNVQYRDALLEEMGVGLTLISG